MKIGIIGLGIVGSAIYKSMKLFHDEVKGYDINPRRCKNSFEEILDTDVVFLALPTPPGNDERIDCSLIADYLEKLNEKQYVGVVVIKSTLSLRFLKNARKTPIQIVYNPEFLHAKTAYQEFANPKFVLMSGEEQSCLQLQRAFFWIPPEKFHVVSDQTAAITKLAMNAFAATKISFVNEIKRICLAYDANIEEVMNFLRKNGRCAPEYSYPEYGAYGGSCLDKDTRELAHSIEDVHLLNAVSNVNELVKKTEE